MLEFCIKTFELRTQIDLALSWLVLLFYTCIFFKYKILDVTWECNHQNGLLPANTLAAILKLAYYVCK